MWREMNDLKLVRSLGEVGTAFFGSFDQLREVQRLSIPPIRAGSNVLVASATASGKTEAIVAPLLARTLAKIDTSRAERNRTRVVAIAPTRALVNDLAARLEVPLDRLNLSLGRQTSDHRDKRRRPFVLITTPESLDSMIVRDSIRDGNRVVDHLLAGVLGVFIDEAHLFDGTARGDQVSWLLARLRRLRHLQVAADEPPVEALQLCAGSATVGEPDFLAKRLLGDAASAVVANAHRRIEILDGASRWASLDASMAATEVTALLPVPSGSLDNDVEEQIWRGLVSRHNGEAVRKALVFVPSRQLCDVVSARLGQKLPKRRQIKVLAHHGSLTKEVREQAERDFAATRDAVLVATTTLEVGVDIGDVDIVALVGAPSGTRSLLQRIGRGGRQSGVTRVLSIPRHRMDALALASMLLDATNGQLEPEHYAPRWSVFVQQVASFIAQAGLRGRLRHDVMELVEGTWPEMSKASVSLDRLIRMGQIRESRDRLFLGGEWAEKFGPDGFGMHANFSAGAGMPVVDRTSGEVIAYVGSWSLAGPDVALSGRRWDVERTDAAFVVSRKDAEGKIGTGFRYAARRAPTGRWFGSHVRRGLGLADHDAPVLPTSEWGDIWLHFGGSAYEVLTLRMFSECQAVGHLSGLAVLGVPSEEALRHPSLQAVRAALDEGYAELEPLLELGVHQSDLPDEVRRDVVAGVVGASRFREWLSTRRVWRVSKDDPLWQRLDLLLSENR